ncbi:spermatogenesis-associated protein 17 [Ciona intestinalis]
MSRFLNVSLNAVPKVVEDLYMKHEAAEAHRVLEYNAAVKIQSWYRGLRVRHYIRHLNASAVHIQRYWRGYMGRVFCRIRIKHLVMIIRMNLYNAMAVRIQKHWRGFIVRKYTYNFYARKRYFEALNAKNQVVRNELAEYRERSEVEERRRQHSAMERKLKYQARKQHYMLSTHQSLGVYNSPFREQPHEMEYRLREARPLSHKKTTPSTKSSLSQCEPLPPIQPKIQGPFKPPSQVQAQRYRSLNPSLRVLTAYNALESARETLQRDEWAKQLTDRPFVPFSKHKVPYEPLLHTTSKYGHLPYGNKYFTEENPDMHVSDQRMQTVVSPIPIFDRYGGTYSKGAVVLQ